MRRVIAACALVLSSCAAQMQGFVGQPLESVMIEYGPPANSFDMPDGTRVFQWIRPRIISSSPTALRGPYGRTTIIGGHTTSLTCVWTMYARRSQNTWVMVRADKGRCQT